MMSSILQQQQFIADRRCRRDGSPLADLECDWRRGAAPRGFANNAGSPRAHCQANSVACRQTQSDDCILWRLECTWTLSWLFLFFPVVYVLSFVDRHRNYFNYLSLNLRLSRYIIAVHFFTSFIHLCIRNISFLHYIKKKSLLNFPLLFHKINSSFGTFYTVPPRQTAHQSSNYFFTFPTHFSRLYLHL